MDSYIRKHAAEAAAQRVRGVSFVAVDIKVLPGSKEKMDDSTIAEAIKESLQHLSVLGMRCSI